MKTKAKIVRPDQDDRRVAALNRRNRSAKATKVSQPATDFGKTLQNLIGKRAQNAGVNEEEVFAGTVYQLIKNRFGSEVAGDFKSAYQLNLVDKPQNEKWASAERATKETLKFFVNSTLITEEEAREIRSQAFSAAQLDGNKKFLWDSLGDTRAVRTMGRAERIVQDRLDSTGNSPVTSGAAPQATTEAQSKNASSKMLSYDDKAVAEKQKVRAALRRIY